jgi:polysaccharide export outer membrane protein
MKKLSLYFLLVVGFFAGQNYCLAATPQNSNAPNSPAQPKDAIPSAAERDPRYQLHASDVIELVFPYAADFNQTVTIQPDGYLGLRGVEEIKVVGMSLPQMTAAIKASYAHIMIDPQFTVTLKDFAKPMYTVAGEVKGGGTKELRGRLTVMQVLMGAGGGFTDNAKHSQVIVFRRMPNDWYEVKQLDAKKMLQSKDLSEDIYVKDGDIIFVPKNFLGKIERFIPTYSLSSYVNPAL